MGDVRGRPSPSGSLLTYQVWDTHTHRLIINNPLCHRRAPNKGLGDTEKTDEEGHT